MSGSVVLEATGVEQERLARVALGELFEPGDKRIDGLISGMSAADLFVALREEGGREQMREARDDISPRLDALRPDRTLELAAQRGIRFVTPADDEWPSQLDDLAGLPPIQDRTGVPLGLWVRGSLSLRDLGRSVAIVGSRSASSYGDDVAGRISSAVASHLVVVSGGAIGIDAAAHRGALAVGGLTVAVLAGGVDMVYPKENERLLEVIAAEAAIVSELPPGRPVTRMRFLGRNRLIAALTRGTVLVEAALRSGAINTANWAASLHRPLMCVPGQLDSVTSQGVHEQVRLGKGVMIGSAEEVLELTSPPGQHLLEPRRGAEKSRDHLSTRHRQVLDAVPVGNAATSEVIAREAGVAFRSVGSALLLLERHGFVERAEDGWQLAPGAVER